MRTAQPSRAVLCSHKNETSLYTNVDKSLDTLLGNVIATICIKYFLKRKYSYMFLYAQNSSVRTHENLIPLVMSREGWWGNWGTEAREKYLLCILFYTF